MNEEINKFIVDEKVKNFIKHVFDTYKNPQNMCKFLESEFEKKGLMCGFNWIPSEEYFGDINVIFINATDVLDRKNKIIRLNKSRYLLSRKMNLADFIFNIFNPEGIFLLEKIQFELEA